MQSSTKTFRGIIELHYVAKTQTACLAEGTSDWCFKKNSAGTFPVWMCCIKIISFFSVFTHNLNTTNLSTHVLEMINLSSVSTQKPEWVLHSVLPRLCCWLCHRGVHWIICFSIVLLVELNHEGKLLHFFFRPILRFLGIF